VRTAVAFTLCGPAACSAPEARIYPRDDLSLSPNGNTLARLAAAARLVCE